MIARCVRDDVTFAELREAALRSGARTLEDLMARVLFGSQCTLCHPYVRRMLESGETEFPAPPSPGAEGKTPARRSSGRGVTHVIFGDRLLKEHKDWVERVCAERALEAVEPLWREPTARLLEEFLAAGGEARIVAVNGAILGPEWLGRPLGLELIPEFERLGVDPCGENGEYHTLVTRWPSFRSPIGVREAGRARHSGYWALDLELTG